MKQYKDFLTEVKDVDEKGRVLVAANAIGNVDADKDRSMDGSFNKTIKENFSRVKWFLNHDKNILLGVPIEAKQESAYLTVLGQLNMKKEVSRDVYEDYKLYAEYNRTLEHSIGVQAVKHQQKADIREVFEWKWWEYSTLTNWGANEQTPLLGIKSDKDVIDAIDWLELQMRKGNYTDERFLLIQKQLISLKSLCLEPENSTQKDEPSMIRNWKQTKSFLTQKT